MINKAIRKITESVSVSKGRERRKGFCSWQAKDNGQGSKGIGGRP